MTVGTKTPLSFGAGLLAEGCVSRRVSDLGLSLLGAGLNRETRLAAGFWRIYKRGLQLLNTLDRHLHIVFTVHNRIKFSGHLLIHLLARYL